jgi:predicted N-acetyltransferase YhbS
MPKLANLDLSPAEGRLPALTIRPFRDDDLANCTQLYLNNEPGRFPPGYVAKYRAELVSGNCLFLVIEEAGQIRAVGGITRASTNHGPVAALVYGLVEPVFHKRGIGSLLLLARLAALPELEKNYAVCMAAVGGSDTFYRRFGFKSLGKFPDHMGNKFESLAVAVSAADLQKCRELLLAAGVTFDAATLQVPSFDVATHFIPWESLTSVNSWQSRIAGSVLFLAGAALSVFDCWGIYRVSIANNWSIATIAVFGVIVLITLFCVATGLRLTLNRPNRYGSILGPAGWGVMAVIFGIVGLFGLAATTQSILQGKTEALFITLSGSACSVMFAYWCIRAAQRVRIMGKSLIRN